MAVEKEHISTWGKNVPRWARERERLVLLETTPSAVVPGSWEILMVVCSRKREYTNTQVSA